jgi:alpha-glucosidase (family GH31 glycosyl hydrolase)
MKSLSANDRSLRLFPPARARVSLIVFAMLTLVSGCRATARPPAAQGEVAAQSASDYTLAFEKEPFSYMVRAKGDVVLRERAADTARTALFYVTEDGGAQYLTEPVLLECGERRLRATYETTDGRRARLRIEPQEHGGFQVELLLEPKVGVLRVGETLAARAGEHFQGLTERVRGADDDVPRDPDLPVELGRRGHFVKMQTKGTVSLYSPFYLSSAGYGLFVRGTWTGRFDMARKSDEHVRFSFDGPSLTYDVLTGGTPERIIEQYTSVAGRPLLPPRWTFGHWRWRNDHFNPDTLYDGTSYRGPYNSMVYEDVMMMERLDIPLSVYWLDRPWAVGARGYGGFAWDRERFPNPQEMSRWLEERGTKMLLWIAPWVLGEPAETALKEGYFLPNKSMARLGIKRAEQARDPDFVRSLKPKLFDQVQNASDYYARVFAGQYFGPSASAWGGEKARSELLDALRATNDPLDLLRFTTVQHYGRVLIDFTNPEALDWWQEKLGTVLDDGVDGFKLDRSEEIVPARRDVFAHDGRSLMEMHNDYPRQYAEAVYEVTKKYRGDDFVLLTRAGYPGSQKYTTFWSGDSGGSFIGLRNALIGGLRASIIGYPLWGSDTGGYSGDVRRDVFKRWLGLSAFSPVLEVGPTANEGPWDLPPDGIYEPKVIATWRTYAKLHMHVQDYTYQHARKAHRTGHPIMRPLFYEHPSDERAWEIWDQYYYGDDYLVAPVLEEGATTREVYLPEGEWIDYWNPEGDTLDGPATVTVEAPLYKTPIFLRAGSGQEILDLEQLYRESLKIARERPELNDGSRLR